MDEPLCVPRWPTLETIVSVSLGKSVLVRTTVLVTSLGLVRDGVTIPGVLGDTVTVETGELTSSPETGLVVGMPSDSRRDTFRVVMEAGGLVSVAAWGSREAVISDSLGERVRAGMDAGVSAPGLGACEGELSGLLLMVGEVVSGNAGLISVPAVVGIEAATAEERVETRMDFRVVAEVSV